jgi:hypothetical protein
MEGCEAARTLRECAANLRRIAGTETQFSRELIRMAEEIEADALRLEPSFRDNPPRPANEGGSPVA